MSPLIPQYIARPFCCRGFWGGEQSQVCCCCLWCGLYRTQGVDKEPRRPETKTRKGRRVSKTVGRRHLALHWVPTPSPVGCDANKPGGHRSHYLRSSLCPPAASVSFAWRLR